MTRRVGFVGVVLAVGLAACRQDMHDQAKYEPYEVSDFFRDGQASRRPVADTVARGWLREDTELYTGFDRGGAYVEEIPLEVDEALLGRGRERFEIFCAPCHGRTGDGQGMIVERGFYRPESFHQPRLREMPAGYYYDVVTNGFGQMSGYGAQVPVDDRWAIAAYIQVLQTSRHVAVDTLPEADRDAVDRGDRVQIDPSGDVGAGAHDPDGGGR